jgi:excisionase family DNA binding protein
MATMPLPNRAVQLPLLSTMQVSKLLQVSPDTVRALVKDGKLPGVKIGTKLLRFRPEDIDVLAGRPAKARTANGTVASRKR